MAKTRIFPRLMRGAAAGTAGGSGYVPASSAGDQDKVLFADRTWRSVTNAAAATIAEALAAVLTTKWLSPGTAEPRILQGTAGRALHPHCLSDNATANRRIDFSPGTAGAVAGLPVVIYGRFNVGTANPSAQGEIGFSASGTTAPSASANGFSLFQTTAGELVVLQNGATPGTDYRRLGWSSFRSSYSGRKALAVAVVFPVGNSTTNPVINIDGVDLTASFSLTKGGSEPNWMPTALDTTKFLVGYNWPDTRFELFRVCLGPWTTAEVLDWTQTGREPMWAEFATGSAVAYYTLTNPSFETDTASPPANWTASGNHVATAVADGTAPGGSNVCEVVASAAGSSGAGTDNLQQSFGASTAIGARIGFDFWAKSISGSTTLNVCPGGGNETKTYTLTSSWQKFRYETTQISAWGFLRAALAAAGTFRIDAFSPVLKEGPIFKPVLQSILYVADWGANGITGTIAAGITPIVPSKPGDRASISGTMLHSAISTSGGTTVFGVRPPGWKVSEYQQNQDQAFDAGATLDLGSAGTTNLFVSALALDATGFKQADSLSKVPSSLTASQTIYGKKSGGTTTGNILKYTIVLERVF